MKKTMRKSIVFALLGAAVVLLSACHKRGERLLTSATGTIYECLIVMPDRPLSQASLSAIQEAGAMKPTGSAYAEPITTTYGLVKYTMGADMPGLPQMEPYFVLTQVPMGQFDNFLKPTRNVLIIDVNKDKYTQVSAKTATDQWSKPQAVYRITAPNDEELVAYWLAHGEEIRDWFVRRELARQITFYRANTNKEARAILQKQGLDMLIPEDFVLVESLKLKVESDSVDVLWCCNNKGPMRKDVLVYSRPYTAQEQFSRDSILAMRDAVMGQLVSAQVEGSHMGTEYKYFPPESRAVQPLSGEDVGFYGIETRGLWKMLDGEAMGGPFVSLTRLDPVNGRVVTAETFLFASGQKKRNALRQCEAILYSLVMQNERVRE